MEDKCFRGVGDALYHYLKWDLREKTGRIFMFDSVYLCEGEADYEGISSSL